MTSRLRTFVRTAGIATAATAGLMVFGAATAAAHSNLVDSNPGDGDTVAELPAEIVMTFSDGVQDGYTEVAVLYDDTPLVAGEPVTDGNIVTQELGSLPPDATAGDVTVSFRIVSADGHPVDGTFTFAVEPADSQTPADDSTQDSAAVDSSEPSEEPSEEPTTSDAATPAAGAASDDGSTSDTSTATLVAIGVAVAVVIAAAGLWYRRRLGNDQKAEASGEDPTS